MDRNAATVWLLLGEKEGDNAQVKTLAEALGWRSVIKSLRFRRTEILTNRVLATSLAGVIKHRSSPLTPPWPDLIITAGRRNDPVAFWIRKRSGGRTRLVRLGRPWAPVDRFDLVVTTPQYLLPPHPKVLMNTLPLHPISEQRLEQARTNWQPRLAHLSRPYVAVLAGGNSGAYTFTPEQGRLLGEQAAALAARQQGSILLTTSPRTPDDTSHALIDAIQECPSFVYRWGSGPPNPYLGLLALADVLIVTGESISMLTEASATGKPVYIVDLSGSRHSRDAGATSLRVQWTGFRLQPLIHRLAMRIGPRHLRRDIRQIHHRLVASGRAAYLGDAAPSIPPEQTIDELALTVERVKSLFPKKSLQDPLADATATAD